jgi:hypothetical protein
MAKLFWPEPQIKRRRRVHQHSSLKAFDPETPVRAIGVLTYALR